MKTPSKNTQRAYAVTTFMMTSLIDKEYSNLELKKIHMQCARAMRVFSAKVDPSWFESFIDAIGDIWERIGPKGDFKIKASDAGVLVEAFSYLITPKDHKDFLGVAPYSDSTTHNSESFKRALSIALAADTQLNELLGTKSVALRRPKVKKAKVKKPREKSKKQKKHEEEVLRIANAKRKKKETLREMIRKAKENATKHYR